MMDNRRIFIANLSKGRIGETHASLLGSLLVTGFELAALSRTDCPQDNRQAFFLYADEFQHCATDSFATILSEARKYGLFLTLAHQYIGQLGEKVRDSVFGNVGSFIVFRVSEADANVLERQFGNAYARTQFTGLDNFEICARLLNREPFLGTSLPKRTFHPASDAMPRVIGAISILKIETRTIVLWTKELAYCPHTIPNGEPVFGSSPNRTEA